MERYEKRFVHDDDEMEQHLNNTWPAAFRALEATDLATAADALKPSLIRADWLAWDRKPQGAREAARETAYVVAETLRMIRGRNYCFDSAEQRIYETALVTLEDAVANRNAPAAAAILRAGHKLMRNHRNRQTEIVLEQANGQSLTLHDPRRWRDYRLPGEDRGIGNEAIMALVAAPTPDQYRR